MRTTAPLPHVEVTARAARTLCFDVVAAGGELLEEHENGVRITRFETTVGRRQVVTVERVVLQPPETISYEWLEGPLAVVHETIWFREQRDGWTTMVYDGRYGVAGGRVALAFSRLAVPRVFARAVRSHLIEAKTIAEQRAARSKIHDRPPAR